jgi:hypothetical protein
MWAATRICPLAANNDCPLAAKPPPRAGVRIAIHAERRCAPSRRSGAVHEGAIPCVVSKDGSGGGRRRR